MSAPVGAGAAHEPAGGFTNRLLLCDAPGVKERNQERLGRGGTGDRSEAKRVVESGYDRIAHRYMEWSDLKPSAVRTWFLKEVLDRLWPGSDVLELGCGSGLPVAKALAESHHYVGVDISAVQLELAREQVPGATFLKGDFTTMDWPETSFDAVVSFYSFNHVPVGEQEPTIRRIFGWLRPGGYLCASLTGGHEFEEVEQDWLGVPMFFAGVPLQTDERMLRDAGFELELSEVREEEEDGEIVSFHWVVARKS